MDEIKKEDDVISETGVAPIEENVEVVITEEDLELNPEMRDMGISPGDILGLPVDIQEDVYKEEETPDAVVFTDEMVDDATEDVGEPTKLKIDGKDLMFAVSGKVYEGKTISSARWNGEKLVLRTNENTEFTLSGTEIDVFLTA